MCVCGGESCVPEREELKPCERVGLLLGDLGLVLYPCISTSALRHCSHYTVQWRAALAFESVRAGFKYGPFRVQPCASCFPSQSPILLVGKMKVILGSAISIANSS